MTTPAIGFCFVSREDYPEFRRISVDGDAMADEYDGFVTHIEKFQSEMKKQGGAAIKLYIKPEELLAWCESKGRPVDSNARAEYAARRLIEETKK
jgi:hypothetical protein